MTVSKYTPLTKPKEKYLQAFFIAMACAVALFVPYMIVDQGYFLFYGDYNVQQVPFYKLVHEAIRSGSWGWSFGTDLGTNLIGSYTFYNIGSPFFWLTIPFPTDFVPYLMGPLFILKFSCASLTAYAYLTRFIKEKNFALMGALMYAFSGYSIYNIFFNHFHEAIVYFPLLLLGMELLVTENRRGFFAFIVCLCALSNYYFFFGMAIFCLIYYVIRAISPGWKLNVKKFFALAFEAVLGVLMSAILLLPSILMVTQNGRISSYLTGWPGLLYEDYQRYGYIIQSLFYPPELPARPVFFPDADAKWSSVSAWLPVFGMSGIIGYLHAKRGTWLKRILVTSLIVALIPILNASFSAFNYSYYARWFYMPLLMMSLATVKSFEDKTVDLKKGWKWATAITVVIGLAIGLYPRGQYSDGSFSGFGLYNEIYLDRFLITCGVALLCIAITYFLLAMKKKSRQRFITYATTAICVVSVGFGSWFIYTGKTSSYDTNSFIIPNLLQNYDTIVLDGEHISDVDDWRIDTYECMDNIGMFMSVSSMNAFHSVVTKSIFDYYDFVGVERVVGSRAEANEDNYAIRSFLSVKYLLDYTKDNNYFSEKGKNKMPGYTLDSTQDDFDIYLNENYIPYGFTYEYYVPKSYVATLNDEQRQHIMLEAIVLDDREMDQYSDIYMDLREAEEQNLTAATKSKILGSPLNTDTGFMGESSPIIDEDETLIEQSVDQAVANSPSEDSTMVNMDGTSSEESSDSQDTSSDTSSEKSESQKKIDLSHHEYQFNERTFKLACEARRASACTSFETDNKGFTAKTTLDKDNLVFFSIPYDTGWTAYVDGVKTNIQKANIGFMAVKVAGDGVEHTIRFEYTTPGLFYGILITGCAVGIFVVYTISYIFINRKRRRKLALANDAEENNEQDNTDSIHNAEGEKLTAFIKKDENTEQETHQARALTPEEIVSMPVETKAPVEKNATPVEENTISVEEKTMPVENMSGTVENKDKQIDEIIGGFTMNGEDKNE